MRVRVTDCEARRRDLPDSKDAGYIGKDDRTRRQGKCQTEHEKHHARVLELAKRREDRFAKTGGRLNLPPVICSQAGGRTDTQCDSKAADRPTLDLADTAF